MPENQVEEVKSKVNIVDIIGEHVRLNRSGSNFKGLCPFHSEKSPSFMVSPDLQIYKCFGCGEGGDVFTFLEKYEGMEFGEALRFLADKVGIKLTSSSGIETSDKDILYELNTLAAKFYNFLLVSHPIGKTALNYLLEERKISLDSIKTFNIGFAPTNKNSLSDFLIKKKKYKLNDIEKAGLVFVSKFGKVYDRFEGRIIFPISDHRGNAIALAGRLLPPGKDNVGKYINSPETLVYHKSSSLYGLSITKDFIRHEGFAVVVEGEIDLISSYEVGVGNIVAIKGSAFTEDQARLLSRYTKEVVLALDTDFAGIEASIRGIKILESFDFEVRVARLGIYKDPDEAAKANPEFLKSKIGESVGVWDFIVDSTVEKYDPKTASGKAKISKFLSPLLHSINNKVLQDHYIKKLAKILEVTDSAVSEEVEKAKSQNNLKSNEKPIVTLDTKPKSIREIREEKLVGLLAKVKPELLKDDRIINLITTPILKRLSEELNISDNGKSLPKELFDRFSDIYLKADEEEKPKDEINNLYKMLAMESAKAKYQNSDSQKDSLLYQKQYKDFDSDAFERIIS